MASKPFIKKERRLPWQQQSPLLDEAVRRLTSTYYDKKTRRQAKTQLTEKEEQDLKRQFKDAGQARGIAAKHMIQISKAIGSASPDGSIEVAAMKDKQTAAAKFKNAGRSTNDLGRGRILLDDVDEYLAFISLVSSKDTDGHLRLPGAQKVTIIDGSINNYIKSPRSSGYAGSLNFDLSVEHGKGRTGRFEVQVMPRAYLDVYDHSHFLYDLIRILSEDIPSEYLTDEDRLILDTLILANKAIFAEHSARSGFDKITKFRDLKITAQDLTIINDVMDRIRNAIEDLPGRNYKWRQEMLEAMTYTKSSALNIFVGQSQAVQNSEPTLNISRE